jgi:hypothetical protein
MKVFFLILAKNVFKNEISKLYGGMEDFTLPSVGAKFKKWKCCTPILPKCQSYLQTSS